MIDDSYPAGSWPLSIGGQPAGAREEYEVRCPWDGAPVGRVARAPPADLDLAIARAEQSFRVTRRLPAHRRRAILLAVASRMRAQAEDLARTLALEAAKPIRLARAEVERAIFTFDQAAEEAGRLPGESLALDAFPAGENHHALWLHLPIGPVAAITPFNFPLNLVAHKLAPALAAGCPVVLKPASQTPLSSLKLAEIIRSAGWPEDALSVLPMHSRDAGALAEDRRIRLLTFTGSPEVGWELKRRAVHQRVTLALGGTAGVIVHADAALDKVVPKVVAGGFFYAGQSCISVQRIFVHREIHDRFVSLLLPAVRALRVGAPLDDQADLCCLITRTDGERVADWFEEARRAGARFLLGGEVDGARVAPAVIAGASPELKVNCREIFAPVVTVQSYADFDEALAAVNRSDYGLQAGVFTNDQRLAWRAFHELEVGGVMINEAPTWRVDQMPYGGVKRSGFGREGVRCVIQEMTEPRLLVLNFA